MNMRKRYLSIIFAMLMVASVFAGPVDKSSAREIANNFLQKKGKSVKAEPARAPRMKGQTTTSDNAVYDLNGRKIVDNYAFLRRSVLQASKARVRIMHSLQAKRAELGSALPKGIYIQNGKKIVVK